MPIQKWEWVVVYAGGSSKASDGTVDVQELEWSTCRMTSMLMPGQ